MSTRTLGTNATTSLTSILWANGGAGILPADLATVAQGIKNDAVNGLPIYPGAFSANGLLIIPNRGVLQVLPGDFVGVDSQGWPILVSANSIANGPWTHT